MAYRAGLFQHLVYGILDFVSFVQSVSHETGEIVLVTDKFVIDKIISHPA